MTRNAQAVALSALVVAGCGSRPPSPAGLQPSGVSASSVAAADNPCNRRCFVPLEAEPPRAPDDLAGVRSRGVLRVLAHRLSAEALPRAGSADAADAALLEALADRLGVALETVGVSEASGLIPALLEGRGDLIGDALFIDAALGVTYTPALRTVGLVVVGRKAAPPPRSAAQVRGKEVWARTSVASTAPVAAVLKAQGVKVSAAPEAIDAEEMLARLAAGDAPLALARSDQLAAYRRYADDVTPGPVLAEGLPVAWAVRKGSPELLEAASALVYERALTAHKTDAYVGDLPEIRKRRVIRVAMLNNPVSYFIYRGQEVGFQYDLAALLAARLSVRLEVVVPDRPADVWRLLDERLVDVVPVSLAAGTEVPPGVTLTRPLAWADQVIVQPAAAPALKDAAELAGKTIYVRPSSAYMPALKALVAKVPGLALAPAPEDSDTEELIDKVGKGQLPLTVSNSALLEMELTYRDDVKGSLVIAEHQPLVWAARADAPALSKRLDDFVARESALSDWGEIHARYFKNKKRMAEVMAGSSVGSGALSPYDDLTRRFGRKFGLDWRLLVAQMYQESRFDPKAVSWMGARGLLQVMPQTGRELGFKDLFDPEQNVNAGVKYLTQMIGALDPAIPLQQRVRFGLAAYNAGFGHVIDARAVARQRGLDANRWFKNVELAMALLEKPEFYRRARHGYVRGREPVAYVSQIQTKYEAYSSVAPPEAPEGSASARP
jgi:membrane-bound lytic murein transglycosylase F